MGWLLLFIICLVLATIKFTRLWIGKAILILSQLCLGGRFWVLVIPAFPQSQHKWFPGFCLWRTQLV